MGMSRINVKGANTQIIDLEMKKLVVKTIKDIFAQMWIIPKVQMDQEWIQIKTGLSGLDPRKVKKRYNKLYDAKRAIVVKQLGKMLESPACQISRIIRDKEVLSSVQEMRAGLINEEIGEKNLKSVQQERGSSHFVQHTAGHSERGKGKAAIEDELGSNESSYMADRPDTGHCQSSYYPQEQQQQQGHTYSDSLATTFDYQLSLEHDHLVPPPYFDHSSNQWHDQHEGGFTSLPPWY